MASPDTAKPATALHGEPASNFEHTGGELYQNNRSDGRTKQTKTAIAEAFARALLRKAGRP